ncbi:MULTISPECIES: AAA family ATPase [Pasteurellaceae]|uniref:AAA family ATPase n=1 Tax=Pasteurella atlantica TaxID=2827233 RepID=A0AAW8CN81_9PAST|nr:AAA family ATPase [Pasteurella atlantica]MBR0573710.1 AAA family ATPase [Pasteurella atlantica]MDP8039655.1 AAA family ATPase [Pasteurella atlantica]MDP8041746.1 AAA family ATPase [Pasteurella atlantica]MDP8043980.1 AAA family ATPase [Pasteurella atlantica]MDP8045958.1 AAA family ATPase [Pasteurella atlantica]
MNLIAKIRQHIEDTNISQSKLAKEIGVTSGLMSSYLNGNYKGNIENVENKINEYFERFQKLSQEFIEAPEFIETSTSKQIFKALDFSRIANCINVIYGASGVGKTKALQQYAQQSTNVWLITASPSRASLSEILYELALEIGIGDAPKRKGSSARLIRKKLMNTNGLVIIDEADHLPYDALEELRIMQEETNIGLVLVGNDKVYNRLRGGSHQAHEFARLWSRIAKRINIQKCKKGDIQAIANAWGLVDDTEAMTVMSEIATKGGGLRSLTQTLRLAGMAAKGSGIAITTDLIIAAHNDLQGTNNV